MLLQGVPKSVIAQTFGVSRQAVFKWKQNWIYSDDSGKEAKRGRPQSLKSDDFLSLKRMLRHSPQDCGIASDKWTLLLIAELIIKEFGFSFSISHISRVLLKHNITYKQTLKNSQKASTRESTKQPINPHFRKAWSLIFTTISDAAFLEGFTLGNLEEKFNVGDKTGRVWRSWKSGKRIAKQETRNHIIDESLKLGWISFTQDQKHAQQSALIPYDIIQSALGPQSPFSDDELPPPPSYLLSAGRITARRIVGLLLSDAFSPQLGKRVERFSRLSKAEINPLIKEHVKNMLQEDQRWEVFVNAINEELTANYNLELLQEQLVAAYRRKGYT